MSKASPLARARLAALAGACIAAASAIAGPLAPELEALEAMADARKAAAAGQQDLAEILLERVLMLMPDHAEARLELAQLMARRGQFDTARGLILSLAEDPRTPSSHRTRLLAMAAQLPEGPHQPVQPAAAQPASSLWRVELGLAGSTNPLARTAATEITFTFQDGPLTLPLSTRPQPGAVTSLSLSRQMPHWGWELASQRLSLADTQAAYRLAGWARLPDWGPWPVQVVFGTQQGFDGATRSTLGVAGVWGPARLLWSAYREPSLGDAGHFLRADGVQPVTRSVQLAGSIEASASQRKSQGYGRLSLSAQAELAPGWRAQAQWTAQADTHGYNPVLASGAPRRLRTAQVAVEKQIRLAETNHLTWRALASERRSNLELFAFREAAIQVLWSKVWR